MLALAVPGAADPWAELRVAQLSGPQVITAQRPAAGAPDFAQPPANRSQPGALGGGFIEFLFTGRTSPAYPAGALPRPSHTRPHEQMRPLPGTEPAYGAQRQFFLHERGAEDRLDPYYGRPQFHARRDEPDAGARAHPSQRAFDPRYERQEVAYSGPEAPGTVVIDTENKFLYLVQEDGRATRYGVGVGREGFGWTGSEKISLKREWPDWRPPEEMRKRQPELPVHMAGGPNNPLGARALYLGDTLYRIHGSNEPWTIGQAVSSGCIRMRNDDVVDLYERVAIGTTVKVI
jgi:lipoprotein-anchoring transpeptidase ErfK/SrfK